MSKALRRISLLILFFRLGQRVFLERISATSFCAACVNIDSIVSQLMDDHHLNCSPDSTPSDPRPPFVCRDRSSRVRARKRGPPETPEESPAIEVTAAVAPGLILSRRRFGAIGRVSRARVPPDW